eukprot:2692429-Pyramimonas_sp.AAC.1
MASRAAGAHVLVTGGHAGGHAGGGARAEPGGVRRAAREPAQDGGLGLRAYLGGGTQSRSALLALIRPPRACETQQGGARAGGGPRELT